MDREFQEELERVEREDAEAKAAGLPHGVLNTPVINFTYDEIVGGAADARLVELRTWYAERIAKRLFERWLGDSCSGEVITAPEGVTVVAADGVCTGDGRSLAGREIEPGTPLYWNGDEAYDNTRPTVEFGAPLPHVITDMAASPFVTLEPRADEPAIVGRGGTGQ